MTCFHTAKASSFCSRVHKEEQGKVRHYVYYCYTEKGEPEEKLMKATKAEFDKAHGEHWRTDGEAHPLEMFHRAAGQLCNAEHFLVRRTCAVKTHIFSVYWAFIALEERVVNQLIDNWYQFRDKIQQQFIKVNIT